MSAFYCGVLRKTLIKLGEGMSDNSKNGVSDERQYDLFGIPEDQDHIVQNTDREIDDENRDLLLVSLMAMSSIKGIGFKKLCQMFDSGFLHQVWEQDLDEVMNPARALTDTVKDHAATNTYRSKEELRDKGQQLAQELQDRNITFIPRGHRHYPGSLLRLHDPPRWIFAEGNISSIQSEAILGIVGTRNASPTGLKLAYRFAKQLAFRNVIVLSGLAKGIDESAHLGAVEYYGQTVAVLGHGINANISAPNEILMSQITDNDGAIISEYLPYEYPSRTRYLRRNEIQVALSRVLVPIECPDLASGTGATIRRASKIGTDVIGIITENTKEKSLIETKANLQRLGHKVFTVTSQNSIELWDYLKSKIPDHDWTINHKSRQDRFFNIIEKQILEAKEKLSLDGSAIGRLAERLEQRLS